MLLPAVSALLVCAGVARADPPCHRDYTMAEIDRIRTDARGKIAAEYGAYRDTSTGTCWYNPARGSSIPCSEIDIAAEMMVRTYIAACIRPPLLTSTP
jgi:hypothetical protein